MKYQVSQITLDFVRKTLGSYPERVMRYLTVQISEPAPSIAIASPPPPPAHGEAIAPESTPEPEPELIELTDEDRDLIEVEIAKIDKLTVSQAEPIMISTATAVHLPVAVRRAYLEAAIAHDGIQKSLKTTASKLLEQL